MATKLNVFAAVEITGEFAHGAVCRDCMVDIANGDGDETYRNMEVVEKNCATWNFTLGHDHKSAWVDSNICYHHGADCESDECDCEREDFSNKSCDMCETTLAGERHSVTMIKRDLLNTRMTQEQFDKLNFLCRQHSVPMTIGDYVVNSPDLPLMAGWIESWVGGNERHKGLYKSTIFVGVSPEGDSHS